MIEIKHRRNEKDAFDVVGRFADVSAHKALLEALDGLSSARLYMGGLRSGNSTALSHFIWALERNDYPPLTFCECSDYWLRCLNLIPQMLRPKDAVESMLIAVIALESVSDENERDELLFVGKDIPLLDSYEDFEFQTVKNGIRYELGVHYSTFDVLTRMAMNARATRSAS